MKNKENKLGTTTKAKCTKQEQKHGKTQTVFSLYCFLFCLLSQEELNIFVCTVSKIITIYYKIYYRLFFKIKYKYVNVFDNTLQFTRALICFLKAKNKSTKEIVSCCCNPTICYVRLQVATRKRNTKRYNVAICTRRILK